MICTGDTLRYQSTRRAWPSTPCPSSVPLSMRSTSLLVILSLFSSPLLFSLSFFSFLYLFFSPRLLIGFVVEQKTYKPIDAGGLAGGQKYIVDKMFVKFASDVYSLYGGDDNSAKAVCCYSNRV